MAMLNNGFQGYTPQIPMNYANQFNNHTNGGITWVQGEAGAKAYPVNAGNSALLMDSEADRFYIKSTDISGMPMPLRAFSYSEILQTRSNPEPVQQPIDENRFVTREEFNELKAALNNLNNTKQINNKRYERKEKAQDGK